MSGGASLNSPMYDALLSLNLDKVKALISEGADVNDQNINNQGSGNTYLYIASQLGLTDAVNVFLQADGVDVNLQNSMGETALHAAVGMNFEDIVTAILATNKASVNVQNNVSYMYIYYYLP